MGHRAIVFYDPSANHVLEKKEIKNMYMLNFNKINRRLKKLE